MRFRAITLPDQRGNNSRRRTLVAALCGTVTVLVAAIACLAPEVFGGWPRRASGPDPNMSLEARSDQAAGSSGLMGPDAPSAAPMDPTPERRPAARDVPRSRFSMSGVYAWTDPDGLWTIRWRGVTETEVTIRLNGTAPIAIENQVGVQTRAVRDDEASVQVCGSYQSGGGLVQFRSSADVECQVSVDGRPATREVYLGPERQNPATESFVLRCTALRESTDPAATSPSTAGHR